MLGFQKWRYSLDKISMFDSIKKQGRNRNKYKENQEENIKNLTKVKSPHFGLNRICGNPNRI